MTFVFIHLLGVHVLSSVHIFCVSRCNETVSCIQISSMCSGYEFSCYLGIHEFCVL